MIREEKQILRTRMKAALAAFPGKPAASGRLRRHLADVDSWRAARVVYGFAPRESEPDWLGPAFPLDKVFAFPRTEGAAMSFYAARDLAPGRFGIREPVGSELPPPPDLILVPGLAFDRSGNRLGWGGGFYDRWLGTHPGVPRLGIGFSCQIVADLPGEPHDLRVDGVLTEAGIV